MDRIVSMAFKVAIALWAAGQLPATTRFMLREAARKPQRGLVSLTLLNHALRATGRPMSAIDMSPLVKGGMVLIGIALATGHYSDLDRWARREVIRRSRGRGRCHTSSRLRPLLPRKAYKSARTRRGR